MASLNKVAILLIFSFCIWAVVESKPLKRLSQLRYADGLNCTWTLKCIDFNPLRRLNQKRCHLLRPVKKCTPIQIPISETSGAVSPQHPAGGSVDADANPHGILPINIIIAPMNCGEGYKTDASGDCREIF